MLHSWARAYWITDLDPALKDTATVSKTGSYVDYVGKKSNTHEDLRYASRHTDI